MNNQKSFSIEEALRFGWAGFRNHMGVFVPVSIAMFVIGFLPNALGNPFANINPMDPLALTDALGSILRHLLVALILGAVNSYIYFGFMHLALSVVDGKKPDLKDVVTNFKHWLQYAIVSFLLSIIVGIGFMLLIIPGIYLALVYGLATYVILDKPGSPFPALSRAAAISSGVRLQLLVGGIVFGILNAIGALLLGLGLLVTTPVTVLAAAYVYRKLQLQTDGVPMPSASPQPPAPAPTIV